MTERQMLEKIAGQLVGIAYDDLSKTEKNIYKVLMQAGILTSDNKYREVAWEEKNSTKKSK